jgi:hypothetical protein
MPWPAEVPPSRPAPSRFVRVRRVPDNDVVVKLPTVSGHHARLVWEGTAGEAVLEDFGSSNGTSLKAPGLPITCAVVTATDTIYLGTHALTLAPILPRFRSGARHRPPGDIIRRTAASVFMLLIKAARVPAAMVAFMALLNWSQRARLYILCMLLKVFWSCW